MLRYATSIHLVIFCLGQWQQLYAEAVKQARTSKGIEPDHPVRHSDQSFYQLMTSLTSLLWLYKATRSCQNLLA